MQNGWYIGVDSGGTKTAFAIARKDGKPVASLQRAGSCHQMIGVDAVIDTLCSGVLELLSVVGAQPSECAGCCLGISCFGENAEADEAIACAIRQRLQPIPVQIANDVEVGAAGSLGSGEGIHLVAGTGAIGFGRGKNGQSARCSGWVDFFGDEGSCYWIGRAAMSVFSKQADGRLPRGALYDIVRKELSLRNDYDFIEHILRDVAPYRDKVAQFQRYAARAALEADASALQLYDNAAGELTQIVQALKNRLQFSETRVKVSYFGGLFKTGELILVPLRKKLEREGCFLCAPERTAVEGALLLAMQHDAP